VCRLAGFGGVVRRGRELAEEKAIPPDKEKAGGKDKEGKPKEVAAPDISKDPTVLRGSAC